MNAMIGSSLLLGGEGYQISRSVRLRSSASAYFNRTPASASGFNQWTYSCWVKRGTIGATQYIIGGNTLTSGTVRNVLIVAFDSTDTLTIYAFNNGSGYYFQRVSAAVFRDPSAWYHLVVQFDPDNATSASKFVAYVNGQQVSWATSADSGAAGNTSSSAYRSINNTYRNDINGGYQGGGAPVYFGDGYQTECNMVSGSIVAASAFGETDAVTGVWKPKKYAGTYGTNGFYLNFSDPSAATAAAIGKDYSGNGNNWTPNNISVTAGVTYDSMLDVPTQWADGGNGRGNYSVMNPLDGVLPTVTNGNLQASIGAGTTSIICGTLAVTSGKWYWEVSPSTISNTAMRIGVSDFDLPLSSRIASAAGGWAYVATGNKANSGSSVAYGSAYTTSNIIGVALDMDTGTLEFFEDGVSQGVAYSTGLAGKLIGPSMGSGTGTGAQAAAFNFGQRPFSYTPPSGFKALNTLNLPTPTILKGNQYFDATLWDGNSTNARVITTNVGTVDFAWVKKRNGIDDHRLANTVTGGNRHLQSNTTAAESTGTTVIQAFSGSTFTLGTDNSVNVTGGTYVGWTWAEGATQGFDIVTFTAPATNQSFTVNHSLGVTPSMIIVKRRDSATGGDWWTWHIALGNNTTDYVALNQTAAKVTAANMWGTLGRSSTAFGVNVPTSCIANGTYVAYLFSEVAGFSRFGSYTGNASTDGPFVFCGFRPRYVMFKRTDSATGGEWSIYDSSRNSYNACNIELYPANSSADETAGGASMDLLSNGFKIRNSRLGINASGGTYIFAAFAEVPFRNALAR